MDFSTIKIGYSPNSKDFSESGDRRRFCSFAKHKGFSFEIADPAKDYDIVLLTYHCDIPKWITYKKNKGNKTKIIFELVDSYLFEKASPKSLLRGTFKYIEGSWSKLYFDYRKAIIDIVKVADAVICTTEQQKEEFLKYNNNVHVILDTVDAEINLTKTDFNTGNKLKLVWEGQSYTANNILSIKDVLNSLKDKIELHLITDPHYYLFSKKYIMRNTLKMLKDIKCDVHYHPWNKESFSENIIHGDLAIIPIDLNNKFASGKPENKLILFWHHAMPVLASGTAAYKNTLDKNNMSAMACDNGNDWEKKIMDYCGKSASERKEISDRCLSFARTYHNKESRFKQWEDVFAGLYNGTNPRMNIEH